MKHFIIIYVTKKACEKLNPIFFILWKFIGFINATLQFLINIIINKTKVLLPQAWVTLADFVDPV